MRSFGIERRQVVEEDLVARFLGRLEVDGVDLDQREVPLAFLGRADLAGDGVAGAQVEAADLRGRDVDVVRTRQVVVLGRAQEAEAVRQAFQHAFGEDQAALLGLGLQDLEDQLLLAQAGGAGDVHVLGDLVELLDAHVLQLDQVQGGGAVLGACGRAACLRRCCLRPGRAAAVDRAIAAGGAAAGGCGGAVAAVGRPLRLPFAARSARSAGARRVRAAASASFGVVRPLEESRAGPAFSRAGPDDSRADSRAGLSACFSAGFSVFSCGGVVPTGVSVFDIACQISLTPRPVTAENGSGSTPSLRMAARPRSCFRLVQLVHLRGDHQVSPVVILEPPLQLQVLLHPSAAGIENQEGKLQGLSVPANSFQSAASTPEPCPREPGRIHTPEDRRSRTLPSIR